MSGFVGCQNLGEARDQASELLLEAPRRVDDQDARAVHPESVRLRPYTQLAEESFGNGPANLFQKLLGTIALSGQTGKPECVDTGGPAGIGGDQTVGHARVLGDLLERRVDQDQAAGRFRRQECGEPLQAVTMVDADPGIAAEVAPQRLRLRSVKLHQDQSIVCTQQMGREGRGAGIDRESAVRVQCADCAEVWRKLREGVASRPEPFDPESKLCGLERLLGPEVIPTGAGVRFDVDQRFGLRQEGLKQQGQNGMLEDVGVIAGVEAVKIA